MNENLRVFALLMLTILGLLLALAGIGFVISMGIQSMFGDIYVGVFWICLVIIGSIFVGQLWALKLFRAGGKLIVDFQAADDRGEVARQKVNLEGAKAQREQLAAMIWGVKQDAQPQIAVSDPRRLSPPADWARAELATSDTWAVIE